jgi:hypothetical protein
VTDGFQSGPAWLDADDLGGGVKVVRAKVTYGDDGSRIDVSTTNPLPVAVISGGGGVGGTAGTEYIEDVASAADPSGPMTMARRRDTLTTSQVSADGDNIAVNATNKGQLHVRDVDLDPLVGALTETAPASDTASSGLNGRLQRIAQRLTTLIGALPASLGIKTAANSLSVAPASDGVFATQPDSVADGALTTGWDGSAAVTTGYGSAVIAVNSLSGGDSIAVKGSLTGSNPKTLAVQDLGSTSGTLITSITADGLYLVPAAGQLTYAKTGSVSTPTINLLKKR